MKELKLDGEYITLGQILKVLGLVYTGGETKIFLNDNIVLVNEIRETRRGRKLYKDDIVKVKNEVIKMSKGKVKIITNDAVVSFLGEDNE